MNTDESAADIQMDYEDVSRLQLFPSLELNQ